MMDLTLVQYRMAPRGDEARPFTPNQDAPSRELERAARSVLVVDDDADVRAALSELLENEGYTVTLAANGRAALDLLETGFRPCAVLLDLMMPVMDGWDFRAEQMQNPELKDVFVVVITAAGFSPESVRMQFGPVPFLPKPLVPDALFATVKDVCGNSGRKPA
jgi:CheY-like chemotaxis protein